MARNIGAESGLNAAGTAMRYKNLGGLAAPGTCDGIVFRNRIYDSLGLHRIF